MRFTLTQVAAAVDGERCGDDVTVAGATIDSRAVEPGALFVPIVAERDGHDFIGAALSAGCAAHLTQGPILGPAVRVDDTGRSLKRLGAAARDRLGDGDGASGVVIGVTGSVGKTTTKDLLRAALAGSRRTHASLRSFNNELGVPLTILQADDDVEALVVEMGARGIGHITDLCAIARPSVGIVLRVGAAHTELFGDLDGVAAAKGELVEALPATGTAVLNADDPRVLSMAGRTDAEVLTFGIGGGDVRAEEITLDDELRPRFALVSPWGTAACSLPGAGVHTVTNALAASAAALAMGVDIAAVAEGLGRATVSPWRMEVCRTRSGALVINDAYNANTLSMHAAIDALVHVPARRRVAVVGLMAELGDRHVADHREIGQRLASEGVEVISVGIPEYGGVQVRGVEEAREALGPLGPDDAVLIKASRVAALERLATELCE